MITATERIRAEYELARTSRYKDQRKVFYPQATFDCYYEDWAKGCPGNRLPEWNKYCDVRDNVPLGTNDQIEAFRRKSFRIN